MYRLFLMLSLLVMNIYMVHAFDDVLLSDKYKLAIDYLQTNKIVQGYSDGTFRPDTTINRAEFVKMIVEAKGIEIGEKSDCFTDVKDDWYAKYVCYAKEQGWVQGYGDGNFHPANEINKVEAIKILIEANGISKEDNSRNYFIDTQIDQWYIPYLNTAKIRGLLEEENIYHPGVSITRGQVSENIFRLSVIKALGIPMFDSELKQQIQKLIDLKTDNIVNNNEIKKIAQKLDIDISLLRNVSELSVKDRYVVVDKKIEDIDIFLLNNAEINKLFEERLKMRSDIIKLLDRKIVPFADKIKWDLLQEYVNDWLVLEKDLQAGVTENIVKDIYRVSLYKEVNKEIFDNLYSKGYINTKEREIPKMEVSFDKLSSLVKLDGYSGVDNEFINIYKNPTDLLSYYLELNKLKVQQDLEQYLKKYSRPSQAAIDLVYLKIFTYKEPYQYLTIDDRLLLLELLNIFFVHQLYPSVDIYATLYQCVFLNELVSFEYKIEVSKLLAKVNIVGDGDKLYKYMLQDVNKLLQYFPSIDKYYFQYVVDMFTSSNLKVSTNAVDSVMKYIYNEPLLQNYMFDKNSMLISVMLEYMIDKGYKPSGEGVADVFTSILLDINNLIRFDNSNNLLAKKLLEVFINKGIQPSDSIMTLLMEKIYSNEEYIKYVDKDDNSVLLNIYRTIFKPLNVKLDQKVMNGIFVSMHQLPEIYFGAVYRLTKEMYITVGGEIVDNLLKQGSKVVFNLYYDRYATTDMSKIESVYMNMQKVEQQNALNKINEIRYRYGLSSVVIDDKLKNTIEKHCRYVNNHPEREGLDKHTESDDSSIDYGGVGVSDRIKNMGVSFDSYIFKRNGMVLYPESIEVLLFDTIEGAKAVGEWVDTVYHRYPLLDPYLYSIGYGFAGNVERKSFCTGINGIKMYKDVSVNNEVIVYPWEGMENVPVSWDRRLEVPDPFPHAEGYILGSVITVQKYVEYNSYSDFVNDKFEIQTVKLFDSQGVEVPIYVDKDNNYQNGYIGSKEYVGVAAKKPLHTSSGYKIEVEYKDMVGNQRKYVSGFRTE